MRPLVQAAVISALAFAAAGVVWRVKGPPVRAVPCDAAVLKPGEVCLDQVPGGADVLWVDARTRREWEADGLPGSVLWSLESGEDMLAFEADLAGRLMAGPSRVVVYCGGVDCELSHDVAKRILALDPAAPVVVLHGGWRALQQAGRIPGRAPRR